MSDPGESTLMVMPDDSAPVVVAPSPENPVALRRADIEAKQQILSRIISDLDCEAAVLLMPAHVSWLSSGMAVRGLIADSERPGIYTNGIQRYVICSNADTHRVFDEELDGLGFQLKEWHWTTGRASLLGELIAGKKVAVDRPYPGLPLINERLRHELHPLTQYEFDQYLVLGRILAHALEATANETVPGMTEADVAGEIAHRLVRRAANPEMISVTAEERGSLYRRSGYTNSMITTACLMQATASMNGLHVTASRTVLFGTNNPGYRSAFDTACKLSAINRSMSVPNESMATVNEAGRWLLSTTPHEYDWRLSQPGFGTGRLPAEELRRMGRDEPFVAGQPLVWQARVGPAAVVDTVVVTENGPVPMTGPQDWPFKRIRLKDRVNDIPDVLIK